jgi:hypothetical protein
VRRSSAAAPSHAPHHLHSCAAHTHLELRLRVHLPPHTPRALRDALVAAHEAFHLQLTQDLAHLLLREVKHGAQVVVAQKVRPTQVVQNDYMLVAVKRARNDTHEVRNGHGHTRLHCGGQRGTLPGKSA